MNASDGDLIARAIEWARTCEYQPMGALMHPAGMAAVLSNGMRVSLTAFPPTLTLAVPRNHEREAVREVGDEQRVWVEDLLAELNVKVDGSWHDAGGRSWALGISTTKTVRGLLRAYWNGCPDHSDDLFCPCGWAEEGTRLMILPDGWRRLVGPVVEPA
jgi:hypothetical protein